MQISAALLLINFDCTVAVLVRPPTPIANAVLSFCVAQWILCDVWVCAQTKASVHKHVLASILCVSKIKSLRDNKVLSYHIFILLVFSPVRVFKEGRCFPLVYIHVSFLFPAVEKHLVSDVCRQTLATC